MWFRVMSSAEIKDTILIVDDEPVKWRLPSSLVKYRQFNRKVLEIGRFQHDYKQQCEGSYENHRRKLWQDLPNLAWYNDARPIWI